MDQDDRSTPPAAPAAGQAAGAASATRSKNTVYVLPPYCSTEADLEPAYAVIAEFAETIA